ncbi:MAG: CPBP family intramembrane glutamic endopeptidase [Pseudomonadota bacterium]
MLGNGGVLAAGGSLPRAAAIASPSAGRRLQLVAEIAVLFVLLPLVVLHVVVDLKVALFLVLPPVLAVFLLLLLIDPTFRLVDELKRGFAPGEALSMLLLYLVAGGALAALVAELMPRQFLAMPRNRPEVWGKILLLYPLLSVAAQELVYRTFFFHRYGPLFNGHRGLLIIVNGLLFGFGHVLFGNWIAVLGTATAGMLLAYRYEATRSFWAVWIEHTLWGWLVFTIGLGGYFFTGVSNFVLR